MPAPGYRSREWKRKNRPKGGLSGIFDAVQDAVSSASSAASSAAQQAASSGRSVTNASPAERAARRRQASRQRQAKRRREARRRQQRASAPSVAESLADLGRTRAERLTAQNLARSSQGEAAVDYRTAGWTGETTGEMLSRVSGQEQQQTPLERAQRRVRRTRREAKSRFKPGPPTAQVNATGQVTVSAIRPETPREARQDQRRFKKAKQRLNRVRDRTGINVTITNTALEVAENVLSEPQGRRQLPQIKRALRTNRGRTLLAANALQGDSEAVASEGQATRFTGVVDPFTRANQASNRAKGGTELLRRKAQQIKVLENQINQRLQAGDQNGARRTYERYQRQVRQYRQTAKRINRAANRSEEQLIRTTRQIAAGKFPGTFKMKGKGADSSIELPSETLQKDQIKNTIEEGLFLNLSPADAGLAVATGFVGRGVLSGAKAAVVGTKLAKEADSGTKLVPAVIAGLQSTNTNTGRIGGAVLRFMSGKGGRRLYRASVAGTGLAAIAGRDYAVPFIEGAADAVSTPSKGYNTIQTTFRNALGTVAALPTLGANLAATVKRAGAAPFVENEYQREVEYITAPAVQLADSMWMELEQMWDVYTSKNPEMISKATQEDYGIGPVFSAYYLLRPFTKGIRRAVGKSGDLVTLPAFGTTNTLADRIAGDRGNVKGVRLTTLPAREAAYEAGEKVAAMVEKMPDYVSNALPFTIGFRNPFSQPDMTPMRGRETLREIGSRRRASSMVFLAKSRAEAMESTMNSQAVRPARIAIQWYNSRKMSPSDRSAYNALEEAVDAANSAIEDSQRAVMPTVEPPKRFTLPDLVNELVSRGLHADRDGNITIDYAMIRALADGQPENSVSKQRLEAILALPRIFDPESKERAMVARIAIGLDRSYQILNAYRRQGIIEEFGEDTPEARAKLDADRNAAALETAIAYEQMTGIPAPARPEASIAALMEERREILADENKDLDTKRKDLERVTSQMREAVRALYNRDLQDRARIRATGVRGRLTQAGKEARKYGIRTRVNEATEWLLVSGGYRQAIGQRLREIANELQSLEARRRARDRRVGQLEERERRVRDARGSSQKLTARERDAIQRWAREGSDKPTQEALRGIRQSREADKTRPFLESALAKQAPLTKELLVLRYVSGGFERELDGDRSKGFVSTTSNIDNTGIGIPDGKRIDGKIVITPRGEGILIRIQPGSRALNIPKILGENPFSESEVLLPPGTRFTRVGETDGGTPIYEAVTPRPRTAEPEEIPGTRALAEEVMRDQIDGESEDQILIAALRAERRELEQQRQDIARHERQMRRDKKLFERANRKVERLTKEMESKVSESLRVKASDLREERAELADEITTQTESLVMFSREMRAALDKEELDAIQRRVEEEIIAEYGPDLDDNGARQVHRRAKERKQARIDSINRRLESHTPLSQRQLGEVLGRIDTLTDELTDAKAELALVLMALREGANRDTAAREFDAIQEGRPERPSGTRYRPGEMGADTIEGRSQVVNDLLERINRLEAEKERLGERVANYDVEIPPQIRRDLESSRADLIKEVGAHADEINRLTLRIIPPERVAKIRKAKTRAAVGVAVETKKREVLADDVAARQAIFDQYVEEAYESGLGQAHYLAHIEPPDPAAPDRTGPSVDAALRTPYEKFRTGELARAGGADRSVKTLFSSIGAEARRQSRQRTTQALMSQAYREVDADGNQKTEYTQEEARVLIEEGKVDGAKFTWLPITMLHDQRQFGPMIDALVNDGASRGKIDAYVKEQLPELEAEEMRLPSGKQRLEEKFLAEGQGVRGVLVPNQSIKIVVDSERKLKGVERILYEFNKVSSRLVLGTSISWMLAQPIAEFLILIMDQSNPARLLRAAKRVKTLRKSEEGRRALALLSGSTYGAARDLRASTRLQQDYNRAVKELNDMPITSIVKEAVRLETLGRVDRWKGAWIREIGAAAELDREQSSLRRAAKAFIGNKDAIEEASAKLAKMSPEEQILWTGTKEGMAVANQIAKNIDDMLGNWTDVKPGFETGAGSLVFFYPFVRFSLRWTFYTYPKRHPIRAALAQIYGALNAEMLEEWMDFDPAWVSDWAAAPVFGGTDEERIVSLVGLNRVSPSGNAFIEYGALSDNPFFTLTKVAPPWLGMIGRAAFGRDPYGAPLVDPDSVFGNVELPGLRTIGNQLLDETANLIAPLRSFIRYTGFKPSEVLAKGDMPWDLLGDIPGMTTEGKGLVAAKGADEQNDRYQGQLELPAPGDDENFIRDLIRREAFALLPKPAHYYKTEQRVNSLFEKRTAAQKDAEYPYPDVMYRGQLQSLSEAVEKIEREKREAMETVDGMSSGWRPTSQQKAYLSRAEKIKEIRDNGERVKENVETSIQNTYREAGLTMGLENKIRKSVLSRKRQEAATLRREWEESVSGEWWAPKEYPGDRQARIDLREIKEIQDTEDGMSAITGPVNTRGTFVSEGQATPRRRKLVETLRAGTRSRLERAGMRRVDLTDPNLDPSTTTRKTKDGNVVVRYRGKPVLGQVPLAAVRQAEQNNTLDVDEDGRLTIPQTRRAVTAVEKASAILVKQQNKINTLTAKAGGVPSGVPEKYRASVRKWGAWLEREMKKNGLVLPYNQAIMDGNGVLPRGMSGAEYLAKILQAESGWDENIGTAGNTSYAGAMGLGQFIPSTRASVLENYGVDAYGDADQQIHAAAILLSKGGMENYNSLFPNSSDDPVGKGGYHYYYEQDVGEMVVPNKNASQQLKAARKQLSNIEKQFEDVAKMARNMGINVNEPGQVGPITYPDKQAKQLNGAWAGTERLLDMANGGDFPISSEKRDKNTVSGGMSDHYVGATGSFAHDLPTTDDAEAEKMMRQYYNRLKLNEPLEWGPGVYKYYTSRKYPGYVFQMLWKSDGDHYDHVHIGARWTGDDLPGGTFYGAGPGSSAPSSGGVTVGGGGAAAGGGGGGQMLWQDADGQRLSLAESQSDMEPIYAAEQIAELSDGEDGQVKSAQNAIAGLPSVKARKKKSLRFDPSTRI